MSAILIQMLDDAEGKTREDIRTQCEIEMCYPFTMNEGHLTRVYATESKRLLDIHQSPTPGSTVFGQLQIKDSVVKSLASLGISVQSFDDLSQKLQPPNEYAKEFDVISGVLAYCQIASQRMIDVVPMRIKHHLVHGFSKTVQEKLIDRLGLLGNGGEERCAALVKEDPKTERERADLNRRKEILVKASEILRAI